MSSLEVALKSTIGYLLPDSSWLVENLPTPPLVRMLIEYIPKLPVINTINGKALPPPKVICDLIKKGVTIRNSIAHIGGNPPSDETVDEILGAIRDIIWLLDYYCGHKWAYDFISKDIRAELEQQ